MRFIELLAPARNKETAFAAIEHGADAVYIGAENFGARAAAGNSTADIAMVVRYAHQFGVRVYVTLNTLLHDDEMDRAVRMAVELNDLGVDAFIIQDDRLRQHLLGRVHLHSSTQMDNRDADTVLRRQQQGYEQTVLARELTIEEIAEIHRRVPGMPLEVFVHGAICVCYNGRCYASEECYGRSANRGECAQFCRMPYHLETSRGEQIPVTGQGGADARYLLSMRDMNRTEDLEALLDAGVTSLKIEGRLKDVAYVKNVTAWYRQHLDSIFCRRQEYGRSSWGTEHFCFTPDITRTFNRGYTDYFMHGRTPNLCTMTTPKSIGQYVGFVKEIRRDHIVVAGTAVFHNGDGLVSESGIGFRVNRADNNHLYLRQIPRGLRDGMKLYRNQDEAMEQILAGNTAQRRIPVQWTVADVEGGFALTATAYGRDFGRTFPCEHQSAQKDQTQSITDVLGKLGDTIYETTKVTTPGNWFIPRSVLAEWRREVLKDVVPPSMEASAMMMDSEAQDVEDPQLRLSQDDGILMQCRYCIRHQTGQCLKENPRAVTGQLFLCGADGRRFPLQFDCRKCEMKVLRYMATLLMMVLLLSSCHQPRMSERHYTTNYNFVVVGDSVPLQDEKPLHNQDFAPVPDTSYVLHDDMLVVAQIAVIPEDSVDSVWVKVARDQYTMGWIHESQLLEVVVPADPISQFIYAFSQGHLLYFVGLIFMAVVILLIRRMRMERFPLVYYHDIDSPYPRALCLVMSASALLYASIQEYIPDTWVEYYFHPTLNPFGQPAIMSGFIVSIWTLVIVSIATLDEIYHNLRGSEMILYSVSLLAVCMVLYLVFTLLPLPWAGYPIFVVFVIWTIYGKR